MYKCLECGGVFEHPSRTPMEQDTGWVEQTCPHCGGDDFEEVYACPVCGSDASLFPGALCKDCRESIVTEPLREFRQALVDAGLGEWEAMSEIVAFTETED